MIRPPLLLIPILVLTTGCEDESERVARNAEEAVRQQTRQNVEMSRLNREVAKATERLVEEDAAARRDVLAAQRDLQAQQATVNEQRDALEKERRGIAEQRRRDSVLGPIVLTLGTGLLCLLPLAVAYRALTGSSDDESEQELAALLVEDLVADQPRLLPGPVERPAIADSSSSNPWEKGAR